MEKKTLPVGTVIRLKDKYAMISGYEFRVNAGKQHMQYVVLPYPVGIKTIDDIKLIDIDSFDIVSMGFTGPEYEGFAAYLDAVNELSAVMSADELKWHMAEAARLNEERSRE